MMMLDPVRELGREKVYRDYIEEVFLVSSTHINIVIGKDFYLESFETVIWNRIQHAEQPISGSMGLDIGQPLGKYPDSGAKDPELTGVSSPHVIPACHPHSCSRGAWKGTLNPTEASSRRRLVGIWRTLGMGCGGETLAPATRDKDLRMTPAAGMNLRLLVLT
jgi:hypothetical protein